MLERLRGEAESLDGEDATQFRQLLAGLEAEHVAARAAMLEALDGERYTALLDRLEAAGDPPLAGDELGLRDIWQSEHARLRKAVEHSRPTPTTTHSTPFGSR